ncbi:hypothetical protein BGZ80_005028 [Entomortierella chlamydospora]|uniref:UBZ3-type domain-containing protein n=1 Tax=Entomortierella chlamydospora TaxID=101097 RepID=A0A9P6T2F1_9FUNG|nr:hypothetical protein BGZ79_002910 [Entomortierella chlamydospora]KAG0019950.1 hypothetical protein BGZ80_005028 [Entomortierella chlamydospora]
MCHEPFHGDIAAFESHVQTHFFGEDRPQEEARTPSTLSLPLSPTLLDPQFDIECDAPGCNTKVNISEMAEHMDRHLAEQIQNQEKAEKIGAEAKIDKRARSYSPEISSHYANEKEFGFSGLNDKKKTKGSHSPEKPKVQTTLTGKTNSIGQTTMDGFIKKIHDTRTFGSSEFTFVSPRPAPRPPPAVASSSDKVGISGVIAKAKLLLDASKTQGVTKQAYLADTSILFIQGDKSDRGWGCGYRNLQMMLSYVVNQTAVHCEDTHRVSTSRLTPDPIPTIGELQQQLEFAWENGFDLPGARQLGHKVVGSRKWIGTTEVWSVLSSLGIRCSILEFHLPTGPDRSHPAMLSAVYNYFRTPAWSPLVAPAIMSFNDYLQPESDQRIIQTAKPPIYIQHQGHSRTIVGIEVLTTGELNLLVFDPGRWLHKAIPTLREESISKVLTPTSGNKATTAQGLFDAQYLLKAFRVSPERGLSKSQYQLLGISGLFSDDCSSQGEYHLPRPKNSIDLFKKNASLSIGWNDEEAEQSKLVSSTRVP